MYISIKRRRIITAVIASMVILGFGGAIAYDAFTGTAAAYAKNGVREIVRYNTYNALGSGLGLLLSDDDYQGASESLVKIVSDSLTENGIDISLTEYEKVREKVERELRLLKEGGYIIIDDDGNLSEDSKSYITNMILRIISGYLPEEEGKDASSLYDDNYDLSISNLEAVQELKRQIGEIKDRLAERREMTPEKDSDAAHETESSEDYYEELEKLKDGLMAVETIIDTMERDLNRQTRRIGSAGNEELKRDEEFAKELAEQNVKLLAQYDSITSIEKHILEIYGKIEAANDNALELGSQMDKDRKEDSERILDLKQDLEKAVSTIEAVKTQMSEKINDEESTLFAAIDKATRDFISYKASMETVTDNIEKTIENLEASMTGTMTSNYAKLEDELKEAYDDALSRMKEEDLTLQMLLAYSNEKFSNEIRDARQNLLAAIEENSRRSKESLDSAAADLGSRIGTTADTTSLLISSILTKAGAMDADALKSLVEKTCDELGGELSGLKSLLYGLRDSVSATQAQEPGSLEIKNSVLASIDDLLEQAELASLAVSDYRDTMFERIKAIDAKALSKVNMSESDEAKRQAIIDASSALIDLQNAQSGYDRELRNTLQELAEKAGQITAAIGDLGQMVDLETQVDSITRSIDNSVGSINDTIGQLGERMDSQVSDLNAIIGALGERVDSEVSGLTGSIGALGERVDSEVSGLTGSIGALGERVDNEVSGLTGSIGQLGERMDSEVSGLTGSIGALGERVDNEVSGLTGSIGALGERMDSEVSGLTGSIGALGERVDNEVSGLTGSIGALGERVDNEVSGLTGSIGALGERVDNEVSGLTGSIGALGERMDSEVSGLTGSIGALGDRVDAQVAALDTRMGSLERETKLVTTGSLVIRTADWAESAGKYEYCITSDEIDRILKGNYNVQISFQYAQGTAIDPSYDVRTKGDVKYICILVNSRPSVDVRLEQVVIYYKAG